jgi:transcriptional regulator with XRE-family HTH domain
MTIHDVIAARRKALDLSQKDLADRISALEGNAKPLAWQTVQQWENGSSAPKRSRLPFVAQALGIPTSTLQGTEDTALTGLKAAEPAKAYDWPFRFDRARFDRLDERDKGAVERAAVDMLERIEAELVKRHAA